MVADEGSKLGGKREDDVEVAHGQGARRPGRHPARLSQGLALGAVAVAAGIEGDALVAARADVAPSAERARAADGDVPQRPALQRAERVRPPVRVSVAAEQGADVARGRRPPPRP